MSLYNYVKSNHTPSTWSSLDTPSEGYRLCSLDSYDLEFMRVASKVRLTLPVVVTEVERVENPFLWGCYELKKAEYRARGIPFSEMELFHCTARTYIPSIVKNNLDWRRANRVKFGMGVSFSPSAKYANTQANMNIGISRATILAKVIVGRCCSGSSTMSIPIEPYDTSTGNVGSVYVKYYDNEFYPLYVA
ncbi:protein mono-ADP-ribosyltransferase PARP12-like [Anabrus simplex]|uniref:protein mono-ADP-ribosyltransferase PARP12-like n=1 Tax=Anabrus simplex TaxID=316456 RepID=UPI0035A38C42